MAKRLAAMADADVSRGRDPGKKANYLQVINRQGRWNGSVFLDYDSVDDPLSWTLPRVIFVNSMSDLFHEDVPDDFVLKVFDVMRRCPQHTFQILTKRPERASEMSATLPWEQNVWMGTSVENSAVTSRVRYLRETGANVKFLSVEPLIEDVGELDLRDIHWVIVGGESGPKARPMKPEWADAVRRQCVEQDVAFFFKQWGGWGADGKRRAKSKNGRLLNGRTWDEMPDHAF